MVIFPKHIRMDDSQWARACALFQVLALDPRQPSARGYRPRLYYETADDYLKRPRIWVDRKQVQAPYYSYDIRFNVSASVHGYIPIDGQEQIDEFKGRVNAALQSNLTVAEKNRSEADRECRRCCTTESQMASVFAARARDEGLTADSNYTRVRESIEASRRNNKHVAASLCTHEEVLEALILIGATCLEQA